MNVGTLRPYYGHFLRQPSFCSRLSVSRCLHHYPCGFIKSSCLSTATPPTAALEKTGATSNLVCDSLSPLSFSRLLLTYPEGLLYDFGSEKRKNPMRSISFALERWRNECEGGGQVSIISIEFPVFWELITPISNLSIYISQELTKTAEKQNLTVFFLILRCLII